MAGVFANHMAGMGKQNTPGQLQLYSGLGPVGQGQGIGQGMGGGRPAMRSMTGGGLQGPPAGGRFVGGQWTPKQGPQVGTQPGNLTEADPHNQLTSQVMAGGGRFAQDPGFQQLWGNLGLGPNATAQQLRTVGQGGQAPIQQIQSFLASRGMFGNGMPGGGQGPQPPQPTFGPQQNMMSRGFDEGFNRPPPSPEQMAAIRAQNEAYARTPEGMARASGQVWDAASGQARPSPFQAPNLAGMMGSVRPLGQAPSPSGMQGLPIPQPQPMPRPMQAMPSQGFQGQAPQQGQAWDNPASYMNLPAGTNWQDVIRQMTTPQAQQPAQPMQRRNWWEQGSPSGY